MATATSLALAHDRGESAYLRNMPEMQRIMNVSPNLELTRWPWRPKARKPSLIAAGPRSLLQRRMYRSPSPCCRERTGGQGKTKRSTKTRKSRRAQGAGKWQGCKTRRQGAGVETSNRKGGAKQPSKSGNGRGSAHWGQAWPFRERCQTRKLRKWKSP